MENLISDPLRAELARAIHALEVARQILDAAAAAGIECSETDARCTHLKETLLQYQQVFGGPKRRKD